MLLAIDAGNTNTVFALFDGASLLGAWRSVTNAARTADEYAAFLLPLLAQAGQKPDVVTHAIIGSVVPDANFHLRKFCNNYFDCSPIQVGDPAMDLGISINLPRPEEVGADRLINAVAGLAQHKPPLLLIDFGTATTFDVVDAKGVYCGGAIAPGINLSLQALHLASAKLPRVGIARPANVIGKNTVEAIQSGVFYGYVGLIDGLIARFKAELGANTTVITTGGLASLFREAIPALGQIDPDLTLRGLQIIFERNRK